MSTSTLLPSASALGKFSPAWLASLDGSDLQSLETVLAAEIDQKCKQDALYWLQTWTATENPNHQQQGLEFRAPFPKKSYFGPLFEAFRTESRLFIPKTREMLTSWCVMGDSAHQAQWERWFIVVQTDAEAKAEELIEYVRILYRNQPEYLRRLHPLKGEGSRTNIEWEDGGRVLAIPKGVNKIRLYHPTRYVMDEAAFLPESEQCFNAAHPVSHQIIAISSAGPGWFGDQCSL